MKEDKRPSLPNTSYIRPDVKDQGLTENPLLRRHKEQSQNDYNIMSKKNADYACSDDPFLNFRMVELVGAASTEVAIYARMFDKMMRLGTAVSGEPLSVEDESVLDTLSDLRNYAHILEAYIKENS